MTSETQTTPLGNPAGVSLCQATANPRPSSGNATSRRQFPRSDSPWSRSKSIWDREPSYKTAFAPREHQPVSDTLTGSSHLENRGVADHERTSQPWRRQANWTSLGSKVQTTTFDAAKLSNFEPNYSMASTPSRTLNRQIRPGPLLTGQDSRVVDLSHAMPTRQPTVPEGQLYNASSDRQQETFTGNDWAFRANGHFPNSATSAHFGLHQRPPQFNETFATGQRTEPIFKQFNEFLPKLSDSGYGSLKNGDAGWSGSPSPISPHDLSHRRFSVDPAAIRSNSSSDSEANIATPFDVVNSNDLSSRSSASQRSQASDGSYGRLCNGDTRRFLRASVPDDRSDQSRQRQHNLDRQEDRLPEWRRGSSATSRSQGRTEMALTNDGLGPFDIGNSGWDAPRSAHDTDRQRQTRQDMDYYPRPNMRNGSLPEFRPNDSQYIYGLPFDGSIGGFQVILPNGQLQQMMPYNSYQQTWSRSPMELDAMQSVRSALLNEYKTDKAGRRWELRDVYDHIVEFCGDQAGSKFIQVKLESANSEERERVFREILPNACQLMCDVFGNYVMQRFFIHGDQSQKKTLALQMVGKVHSLAKQMYGCRVLQKALKHVLVDQQAALAGELKDKVLELIKDQNGNHVIQKILKRVPWQQIPFVVDTCVQNLQQLAVHNYGCRVIQRLLRHYDGPMIHLVLQELHACSQTLITDQYGNYVTQHIIEYGAPQDRGQMIQTVRANLVVNSKQKFASNVVEKCIVFGNEEERRDMMLQLCHRDHDGSSPLGFMIKDNYANYVIQKLLDVLNDHDYSHFVQLLEPEIMKIRRSLPNKQAENVYKKMLRHRGYQNMVPQQQKFPMYARLA